MQHQWGKARWSAFLRGDNLAGKTYAGTVIINEANRRYFEPAAGRTWLTGVSLSFGWRAHMPRFQRREARASYSHTKRQSAFRWNDA